MLVYGYTEENVVVPADLPTRLVARLGIDAWRLDLCDKDPARIVCKVGSAEQCLSFRKLTDLTFAYRIAGGPLFVCWHRKGEAICVLSDEVYADGSGCRRLILKNFRISRKSFTEHFAVYLQLLDAAEQAKRQKSLKKSAQSDSVIEPEETNPPFEIYRAEHYGPPEVQGKTFRYHWVLLGKPDWPQLPDFHFDPFGEMFKLVPAPVQLTDAINWLLEEFKQWNPVVVGDGLRPFYMKRNAVSVQFPKASIKQAHVHARAMTQFEESHDIYRGDRFQYGDLTFDLEDDPEISEPYPYIRTGLSLDMQHCVSPNQAMVSRICLFDIASKTVRAVEKNLSICMGTIHQEGLTGVPFYAEPGGTVSVPLARPVTDLE
jgi:hypothetical protein